MTLPDYSGTLWIHPRNTKTRQKRGEMECFELVARITAPYDGEGAKGHHEDGSMAKFREEMDHLENCKTCLDFLSGLPSEGGLRIGRRHINPWFAE